MIPMFMRFYSYTLAEVLDECAKTFFSLINSMYEINAQELLNEIAVHNADHSLLEDLKKRERGISGLVDEVKIAKKARQSVRKHGH